MTKVKRMLLGMVAAMPALGTTSAGMAATAAHAATSEEVTISQCAKGDPRTDIKYYLCPH